MLLLCWCRDRQAFVKDSSSESDVARVMSTAEPHIQNYTGMNKVLLDSTIAFAVYSIFYLIQHFIIFPLEAVVTTQTAMASFFFLPHAARVLSTSVMGWRCAPGLVAGHFAMFYLLRGEISAPGVFMHILIGGLCAPVAFELLKMLQVNASAIGNSTLQWKHIVLAGIIASVINSFAGLWFLEGIVPVEDVFALIWTFLVGDILGLIVVMLTIPAVMMELFSYEKKSQ